MCQTYKIAICDDFAADRKYLSSLCERWSRHNCYRIQISEFTSAENFLFYYAEKKDFDILLLDIEMGAMDGVTMARKLRQDNQTVQIIFITGYADYISDGYEVCLLYTSIPSASVVVALTSPLIGPSTISVISLITSLKSLPSFAIRDGFVAVSYTHLLLQSLCEIRKRMQK